MSGIELVVPALAPSADYERATSYHTLYSIANRFDALAAGTWLLGEWQAAPRISTGATAAGGVFWMDPANYSIGTRTLVARLRLLTLVNAVAPACDFTLGLYPVTAAAGGAGIVTVTLGAVVAGSTVVISAPAAGSVLPASGADFAFPAVAGAYCMGVLTSGAMTANSSVVVRARLQTRSV